MVGVKPAVTHDKILQVLKTLNIFSESGELLVEKNDVWQQACKLLNNLINVHNLYIFVHQDRYKVLTSLKEFFKIDESLKINEFEGTDYDKEDEGQECDNNEDSDFEVKELPNPAAYKSLNFKITLCASEWEKIKPIKKSYADGRTYTVFQSDWTDVVSKGIWKHKKIMCNYAIKKHNFYSDPQFPFFEFHGFCNECSNFIRGMLSF